MSAPKEDPRSYVELEQAVLDHFGVKATSHFFDLPRPKVRTHVLEAGTPGKRTALVMHGGDGEAANFAGLMAELQDDLHMYAVDRPGFGRSGPFNYDGVPLREHAVDFVTSLLDALGLRSTLIIATSMSGYFALTTALDRSDRVDGIVLLGYPVGFAKEANYGVRMRAAFPWLARKVAREGETAEGQWRQYQTMFRVAPDALPDVYYQARAAAVREPGVQETWVTLRRRVVGLRGPRPGIYLGEELSGIDKPMMLLWGANEPAPAEFGRKVVANVPDCRFEVMPGVGHFPYIEAPKETAAFIREYLRDRGDVLDAHAQRAAN